MLSKICSIDLKSGILCPKCEERVNSGEISKLDLEIAKTLTDLENRYAALQTLYFHKSVVAGDTLAILVNKQDVSRVLSYGGKILKEISEKTGRRKIRIIGFNEENKRFLEDLFTPAQILAINKIWLPDGSTETKVVIPRRDERRLPANPETLKDLARSIKDMTLRIELEP